MLSISRSVPAAQLNQYRAMLAPETQFPCNRMMSQETPWGSLRRIFNNEQAVPSLPCGTANPSKTEENLMCKDCYSELKHQQDKSVEEIPLRGSAADIEAQAELDSTDNRNVFQRFYDNHPTASKVIMGLTLGGVVVATIGTVAAMTAPKTGDNQSSQNTNETCLEQHGQLFYADNNNCVARPAVPEDCRSEYQYFTSDGCKAVDEAFCTTQEQIFSNGKCRTKTAAEAQCTDSQIYVESNGSCRAKEASDCNEQKQVFDGDNCRPLQPSDCDKKGLILDDSEKICRNLKTEDCAENGQVLGNDGKCRNKTAAEAQCTDSQIYVESNGSCRAKEASDCNEQKQVFDKGNCRSLQSSDCAERQQILDIAEGICRDITEEDCTKENQILENKQCRTRTQQDCKKTGQWLDAANTCQDWTPQECKKTQNKNFDVVTQQCKKMTAKDCIPQKQWFDGKNQDCEEYTQETCEAEGKKFEPTNKTCLDFTQEKNCEAYEILDALDNTCRPLTATDCHARNQTVKFEKAEDGYITGCRPWTEVDCDKIQQNFNPTTETCTERPTPTPDREGVKKISIKVDNFRNEAIKAEFEVCTQGENSSENCAMVKTENVNAISAKVISFDIKNNFVSATAKYSIGKGNQQLKGSIKDETYSNGKVTFASSKDIDSFDIKKEGIFETRHSILYFGNVNRLDMVPENAEGMPNYANVTTKNVKLVLDNRWDVQVFTDVVGEKVDGNYKDIDTGVWRYEELELPAGISKLNIKAGQTWGNKYRKSYTAQALNRAMASSNVICITAHKNSPPYLSDVHSGRCGR